MYSVDVKNDLKNTEALESKIVMLQFFLFWLTYCCDFYFLNYVTFFIHPYLLDPIAPWIAQSMDQLISAQFTERKQS